MNQESVTYYVVVCLVQFVKAARYISNSALQLGLAVTVSLSVWFLTVCAHMDTHKLHTGGVLCKCSVPFASKCVLTPLSLVKQPSLLVALFRW